MKPILNEVAGKNRFCGPTALATILGITTDEAAFLIRRQSGQRAVKSAHTHHLVGALRDLGCRVQMYGGAYRKEDRPTVATWLSTQAKALPIDRHIVLVHGHHFGTLLGRRYLCTLTKRQSVLYKDIPKRRARVEEWFVVHSLPDQPVVVTIERKRVSDAVAQRKANALAVNHDIEIEVSNESVIVWGLKGLPDAEDPYAGDHYADGWVDALEMAKAYAEIAIQRDKAKATAAAQASALEPA